MKLRWVKERDECIWDTYIYAVNFKQIYDLIGFFHQVQFLLNLWTGNMSSQLARNLGILEDMKPSKSSKSYEWYDAAYERNMSQLVSPVQDILEDMKPSKSSKAYDLDYDVDYDNFVNMSDWNSTRLFIIILFPALA